MTAALRVLLIDDDEATHECVRHFLSSWSVVCAFTVRDALDLLAKGAKPDVILLDLKIDGEPNVVAMIPELKRFTPTALIVLSGSVQDNIDEECFAAGADDFFSKELAFTSLNNVYGLTRLMQRIRCNVLRTKYASQPHH